MSGTPAKQSTQDRTRAAIIEAAARRIGDEGMSVTLDSVAEAAGVSRATLYRYFSSRDELVLGLIDAAYAEYIERVRDANIDTVPFPEAFARLSRAVAHTGSQFVVLQSDAVAVPVPQPDDEFEQALNDLFDRGKTEGSLRPDIPTPWMRAAYRGIAIEALRYVAAAGLGAESAAALIVDQFLRAPDARNASARDAQEGDVARDARREARSARPAGRRAARPAPTTRENAWKSLSQKRSVLPRAERGQDELEAAACVGPARRDRPDRPARPGDADEQPAVDRAGRRRRVRQRPSSCPMRAAGGPWTRCSAA